MTTLGLLSDTHGRAAIARDAVQLLLQHGADRLVHLGDVGSVEVIDALAANHPATGQQIEAHLVMGNCDWEIKALTQYAQTLGIAAYVTAGEMVVDEKRVVLTHGHVNAVLDDAIDSQADYLLHGHTHLQSDHIAGSTRVINPGALFRASKHTVALLTPKTGEVRVMEVAGVAR